jgi:hypothetical protein
MTNSAATDSPVPKSNSYVARHWRGELSLSRSWWINGALLFGIGVNAAAVIAITLTLLVLRGTPALAVILALGELFLQVTALVWTIVGIWRAASRYSGRKLWAVWAKAGVCLGMVYSILVIVSELSAFAKL